MREKIANVAFIQFNTMEIVFLNWIMGSERIHVYN